MPSPIYTLGGNFMKLGTTSNGISGAVSRALGRSDTAPRPPPRPPGGVWAPPGGVWAPPGGAWAAPGGAWVWANMVMAADSASVAATKLVRRVFIGPHLDSGGKM